MGGTYTYPGVALPKSFRAVRIQFFDIEKSHDAIDRCTDIVRHAAQEIRFGYICPAGFVSRLYKFLLPCQFFLLIFVNNLCHIQDLRKIGAVLIFRDNEGSALPQTVLVRVFPADKAIVCKSLLQCG